MGNELAVGCGAERCTQVCERYQPSNGRRFCRHELVRVLGPDPEAVLEGFVRLGVIRSWKRIGEVVFVDGAKHVLSAPPPRAIRPTPYASAQEHIEVAMEAVLDAEPGTIERRRAWQRARDAAWSWIEKTTPRDRLVKKAREWLRAASRRSGPKPGVASSS